jgi:hypothetical protein
MTDRQTYVFTCRVNDGDMPHGLLAARFGECVSGMLTSLNQDVHPYLAQASFFDGTLSLTLLLVPRGNAE